MTRATLWATAAQRIHEEIAPWGADPVPLRAAASSDAPWLRVVAAAGVVDGDDEGAACAKLDAWIADASAEAVEAAAAVLRDAAGRPCDPIAPGMLIRRGVNPLALLAVELSLAGFDSAPGNADVEIDGLFAARIHAVPATGMREGAPYDYVRTMPKPGTRWSWNGRTLVAPRAALPDTALAAIIGRPVADVVDHSDVASCGGVVASTDADRDTVALETDRVVEPSTWIAATRAALAAMEGDGA